MPRASPQHFDATVDKGFAADGTIREKYNVVSGNSDVKVSAGYTTNEVGFGWTNAVYLKMEEVIQKQTITKTNEPEQLMSFSRAGGAVYISPVLQRGE